eukprot:29843-Pelagococcus_subviridis.AAC.4
MLDAVKKLHAAAANEQLATRVVTDDVAVHVAEPGPRTSASSCRAVRAPRQIVASEGTEEDVIAEVRDAGLELPLLAKSLVANGTADSHKVAIVHDVEGLRCVVRGDVAGLRPPCVIQEYVNHGGCLFKVYVVGDVVTTTRRKSLPDLAGARRRLRRRRKVAEAAERRLRRTSRESERRLLERRGRSSEDAGGGGGRGEVGAGAGVRGGGGGGGGDGEGASDGDADDDDDDASDAASFDDDDDDDDEGEYSYDREGRDDDDDDDDGGGGGGGGSPTGAQSVPRVSCFKGGPLRDERSWRDRLSVDADDELRGAFYLTLVPIRPRSRGERRFLRTFLPGVCFSPPTPRFQSRRTSTPFNFN